jgi:NAD(P)-dependent dehydrogenase (short-subunit alcohol dehydrogenase family)
MRHEKLKGKVIVITGAAGVLCSCMARAAAKQKMRVALLGRTFSKVQALADEINADGGDAIAVECDVTNTDSVHKAKKAVNGAFGKVDMLINGAGGNHPNGNTTKDIYNAGDITHANGDCACFFDLVPDDLEYVFRLNFTGSLIPSQVFLPDMLGNAAASVINISSMSAYHPITRVSAYSAAKAAITNFTEWLAVHFAKEGVRVNAIAPGWFETIQNKTLLRNPDGTLTNRSHKVLAHTPMGRFGEPEELIGTLLWLLDSSESGFVTGAVIPVDGGFIAASGV